MGREYPIIDFKKEKEILTLTTDSNKKVKINFNTNQVFGVNGRVLKERPIFRNSYKEATTTDRYKVIELLNDAFYHNDFPLSKYEPFFSYLELVPTSNFHYIEIEKGVVTFLKENNLQFNKEGAEAYRETQEKKKYGLNSEDFKGVFKFFLGIRVIYPFLDKMKTLYKNELHYCLKTFEKVTTPKDFYLWLPTQNGISIEELFNIFDMTKGLTQNLILAEKYVKDKEENLIKKAQGRFSALDGKIYKINGEELIMKIPMTLTDLKDEGEQQHNCIGVCWNNHIEEGENFIYFLRRKNAPTESYITCRFNITYGYAVPLESLLKTVETRYAYNRECIADFSEIDKDICAILNE